MLEMFAGGGLMFIGVVLGWSMSQASMKAILKDGNE